MYGVVPTKEFARSLRKLNESGRYKASVREDLEFVIDSLRHGEQLPPEYVDHPLKGEWQGHRECHIRGDLLLVYRIVEDRLVLVLVDIGSHSYLFG